MPPSDASKAGIAKIGDLAASAGLRRIHLLSWRDLEDVEAGGSEVHASTVARLWAEAGVDVTLRTSYAQGHAPVPPAHPVVWPCYVRLLKGIN